MELQKTIENTDKLIARLTERLKGLDKFLISTHRNPDPDGLGAEVGLYFYLHSLGKNVQIINDDAVPARFENFYSIPIQQASELGDLSRFEDRMIISVDNSDLERLGTIYSLIKKDCSNVLIIDHHDAAEPDLFFRFQSPAHGSTCEIISELLLENQVEFGHDIARALYCGIVADTGHFRYSKTRADTHRLAAAMLDRGVNPTEVNSLLHESYPLARIQIKRDLYSSLQIIGEELAYMSIDQKDLDELDLASDDIDGILNELLEAQTIRIALLFSARSPEETKISLRSRAGTNVLPAVEQFGGGGHKNACGVSLKMNLAKAIEEFLPVIGKCL